MPSLKATGMQTIINGFLRHKINLQKDLTWQTAFEKIRDDPQVIKQLQIPKDFSLRIASWLTTYSKQL